MIFLKKLSSGANHILYKYMVRELNNLIIDLSVKPLVPDIH